MGAAVHRRRFEVHTHRQAYVEQNRGEGRQDGDRAGSSERRDGRRRARQLRDAEELAHELHLDTARRNLFAQRVTDVAAAEEEEVKDAEADDALEDGVDVVCDLGAGKR